MKRWTAVLAVLALMLAFAPSVTAYTTDEPLTYSLVTYADRVKLLGEAGLTDEGVHMTRPLDGVAFYAEGDAAVEATVHGNGVIAVFVDAVYRGDITVSNGKVVLIDALPDGMHRVELVYGGGDMTLESLTLYSSFSAVPYTPRVLVFDTAAFSVAEMMQTAHRVGMDCRIATQRAIDTAGVVVTDGAYDDTMEVRYPNACTVSVGETTEGYTYVCEPQAEVLSAYLKSTAVPSGYFEELRSYVEMSVTRLQKFPPTKENAQKMELEIAVAENNDGISGVLFSLYDVVRFGPRAAKDPPEQEKAMVNSIVLTAVLAGGGFTALLVWALVMVNLKPKKNDQEDRVKEESE